MTIEYITTRELQNSSGDTKGKIRIVKMKEDSEAQIELTCPECGANEKKKEAWGEPFVQGEGVSQKFNVKCDKCGFSTKLLKLKKEIKKK